MKRQSDERWWIAVLRNALEPWHVLVLVLVVVVLFGSRKLPEAARAVGKSVRILRSEAKAMKSDGGDVQQPDAQGSAVDSAR